MAVEFQMPKLAMAMQQGTVMEWKANEGDSIEKGQAVLVIETEKVSYDCEAPENGLLHILVQPDTTVDVYTSIALIAETEEELVQLQQAGAPPVAPAQPVKAPEEAPVADTATGADGRKKVKISPLAKKMARQNNLDITRITGTGPGGRIGKKDVLNAIEAAAAPAPATPAPAAPDWSGDVVDGKRVKATVPVRGMRKAIGEHMIRSLAVSAQLSSMAEVDMTEMIKLRKSLLTKEDEAGVRISYTDLLILAMVKAVQHVPMVNSTLIGDEIKIWEDINVSIAVALEMGEYESGLIVPVLRNCEKKSLVEISRGVKDLGRRARSGELLPEDLSGGTITISNTGMLVTGWGVSTPILNQPQAMLLQPGGIFEKPVAIDGQVVVRPVMTTSVTWDHRILDGAPIGKFMAKLMELIRNPEYLHL
ncbi:MAG: 2-oxo acid dehydrogenase subunit E2 [Deltaproteobacteria bacterium]|nr:2-oxo acid dehydrogenase subunit E2 [Deltaproteobacteria bacterium]